jgi:hypothetical protein
MPRYALAQGRQRYGVMKEKAKKRDNQAAADAAA